MMVEIVWLVLYILVSIQVGIHAWHQMNHLDALWVWAGGIAIIASQAVEVLEQLALILMREDE